MSSLTATVDTVHSWVRLDLDVSDVAPIPTITITRTNLATGATATVRPYGALSGGLAQPVGGRIVMYDCECPNDVPVQYTATYSSGTSLVQLNVNPGAENGILSPWTAAAGGTLAPSQAQAAAGYWSLAFTPDGVTANPAWQSEEVPAVVGKTYTVAGQLRSTATATWSVGVRWYDATHTALSTAAFNVALVAGTWTAYSNTAVAPASAAYARIYVQASGTPAASNILNGDSLTISTTVSVSVTSTVVIDPSNGYGWLVDPLRPYNNVRLDMTRRQFGTAILGQAGQGVAYLGLTAKTRKSMGLLADVNNAQLPVGIARVRRGADFSINLNARSFTDRDAVNTLLQPGSALLLQLPSVYGEPDRYVWPADTTETPVRQDQRRQERVHQIPVTHTSAPGGPMGGTLGERIVDLGNHYSTWGALAAGKTGVYDSFTRTVAPGGWGTPDNAPGAWSLNVPANCSVAGGLGVMSMATRDVTQTALVGSSSYTDTQDVFVTVVPSVVATGADYQLGLLLRYVDANNTYWFYVDLLTGGSMVPTVAKSVGGAFTTVATGAAMTYTAGASVRLHASLVGSTASLSVWLTTTVEPGTPNINAVSITGQASGQVGLFGYVSPTNTNALPVVGSFDDLLVVQGPTWQGVMDGAVA